MSLAPASSPLLCLDSRPGLPAGAAPAPAGPMGVGLSPQSGTWKSWLGSKWSGSCDWLSAHPDPTPAAKG